VEEILENPLGHASRVPAIREANLRLLGRPETTGTVAGDPDKPIRIVVESISSRRREQLADVEAEETEVEELSDSAAYQRCVVVRTSVGGPYSSCHPAAGCAIRTCMWLSWFA
jgi:hypothetical protein